MSQRTKFSTITPLPPGISRQTVITFLHDHKRVIDLSPLVKERHSIRRPLHAAPDELRHTWYSITDHASYLPCKMATGEVTYTCAFNNLPNGLQSHCYAPAGLDIRQRWLIDGSEEPSQAYELAGLYIREDVDIMCNRAMTDAVKRTLKDSHTELVARLKLMAQPTSTGSARAAIQTNSTTSGFITTVGQQKTDHNVRNLNGAAGLAVDGSKHLAVYSWLKSHEQRQPPQQHSHTHSRSSSDRSTGSSGSSSLSQNSSLSSPVSSYASTPSYRNMVVSPPTPAYSTPMASPLWAKLQPPPQTTAPTLASLSPGRIPPKRPPRPEEREMEKQRDKEKPVIRLIPEPLRIPRASGGTLLPQSYSPVNINNGPRQIVGFGISPSISPSVGVSVDTNLSPQQKLPTATTSTSTSARRQQHRKFSYDSTSSTENYLVTSPPPTVVVINRNSSKGLPPPPQHISSQSREYHEAEEQVHPVAKESPPLPSSPILHRLKKYMGTDQHVSFDPFEPHPDYPHMSPYDDEFKFLDSYHDDDDDDDDDDDEYEDDLYQDESDKPADSDDAIAAAREIRFRKGKADTLDDYYAQYLRDKPAPEQAGKSILEESSLMSDGDSGYADLEYIPPPLALAPPMSKGPLPQGVSASVGVEEKEQNQMVVGATLSGPFVAAFDEFNICLP